MLTVSQSRVSGPSVVGVVRTDYRHRLARGTQAQRMDVAACAALPCRATERPHPQPADSELMQALGANDLHDVAE